VAHGGKHVANLPLLALMQHYLEPNASIWAAPQHHFGWQRFHHARPCRRRAPFGEVDPAAHLVQHFLARLLGNQHVIGLGMFKGGVGEAMGQFAIIRQQDEPFAVKVQPPHREDTPQVRRHQVGHRAMLLGVAANIGNHPARLVELDVDVAGRHAQGLALDADLANGRVHLDTHFSNRATIDLDETVDDHLLAGAAAAQPGSGHNLV
jgi:hypothetical protein